jgi:hypothetical protein
MPIELRNETLLTLNQVARLLPPGRNGRPVHLSCVFRWIRDGVKTPHGKVRLEGIRVGHRWLSSAEAVQRFAEALTPDLAERPQLPRTSTMRRRASERAEQELQKLGL